ncbi:MAG: lipoate--protein ligase [Bacteroidetes bacterium]|nr:lipoate--protein ligase [Bacteroidota bacterium]
MKYIEFDNQLKASYSFALEEFIMTNKQSNLNDDYFFIWNNKPTLMVGRFQNPIEEINCVYATQNNIDIIRRNSGGGTIYTDENCWQFSFITHKNKQNTNNFHAFTKPILYILEKLGLECNFSGRNDLILNERKFSGNAQFSLGNRCLHHGSILFDADLDKMNNALTICTNKIFSKSVKSAKDKVINIKPFLSNPDMTSEDFKNEILNIVTKNMETITISKEHIPIIKNIEHKKFLSWEWNYGKSPEFNVTKRTLTSGGNVIVNLNIKDGIINDCKLNGDFFFSGNIDDFTNHIINCKYEKSAIYNLISETNYANCFYLISIDELIDCFII